MKAGNECGFNSSLALKISLITRCYSCPMAKADYPFEQRFIDQGDWLGAIMILFFLIIFPICIIAIWLEPRDAAPLHFAVPFTAIFSLSLPVMVKELLSARTREFLLNCQTGEIILKMKRPLHSSVERIAPQSISKLIFQTTDNDGYWHHAMLEISKQRLISFAQGGHEPAVRAEYDRMIEALKMIAPHVQSEELRK